MKRKYSYKELSGILEKPQRSIISMVHSLQIPKKLIKGRTYIYDDGLDTLQAHYAPKRAKNSKKKIDIVEGYLKYGNYRQIARILSISRVTVKSVIEEWEKDHTIVVDSSLNFPEKKQIRGVFERAGKWGYSFMFRGKRYYEFGFENEYIATEIKTKIKNNLK